MKEEESPLPALDSFSIVCVQNFLHCMSGAQHRMTQTDPAHHLGFEGCWGLGKSPEDPEYRLIRHIGGETISIANTFS